MNPVSVVTVGDTENHAIDELEKQQDVVRVIRRCPQIAQLLAACQSGLAQVAVVADSTQELTATHVDRLTAVGVCVVAVPATISEATRLRGIGAFPVTGEVNADRIAETVVAAVTARMFHRSDGFAVPTESVTRQSWNDTGWATSGEQSEAQQLLSTTGEPLSPVVPVSVVSSPAHLDPSSIATDAESQEQLAAPELPQNSGKDLASPTTKSRAESIGEDFPTSGSPVTEDNASPGTRRQATRNNQFVSLLKSYWPLTQSQRGDRSGNALQNSPVNARHAPNKAGAGKAGVGKARVGKDGANRAGVSKKGTGKRGANIQVGGGFAASAKAAESRTIAVWGPIGSPGRTTLVVNLAAELAAQGQRVLVIDADSYGASIAASLGLLDESASFAQACRVADQGLLSGAELAKICTEVVFSQGSFSLLTGLTRADRWPELRAAAVDRVIEAAKTLAQTVIIDCGFCLETDEELSYDTVAPRRNAATLSALSRADTIYAVGVGDTIGVPRLIRAVADLVEARGGSTTGDVQIVINKVRKKAVGGSPLKALEHAWERFGPAHAISHFLPWDAEIAAAALLEGQLLLEIAPQSPLRLAIHDLSCAYVQLIAKSPVLNTTAGPVNSG